MAMQQPPGLEELQEAIQAIHQLMTVLPDPRDTAIVAQCLKALTGIQQEMMQTRPAGAAQALVQQLTGQGGGPGGR
jgi:hypothetical protein